MNPEQWERVQDLFLQALQREPAERQGFIDAVAEGDTALRYQLTSLLRAHEEEGVLDGRRESPEAAQDRFERVSDALSERYEIQREIGRGGMATVYLARDRKHQRDVAVKVLHPALLNSLGADRFLAEISTTANLQHPHILPLFDSGRADGYLYYVMPYVKGETLRTRLNREKQLPVEEAVRIAREVADALQVAHEQGVIHRDIKPGNILLSRGRALVLDFGISIAMSAAGGGRITETGLSLGTPRYMSPEQASGDRTPDARSDVFSLGCVLYEMLVGETPHSGGTIQAIIAKLLKQEPVPPRTIRDTVPKGIEAAVLRALAKVPADRFESAGAFRDALARGGAEAARGARRPGSAIWLVPAVGAAALAGWLLWDRAPAGPDMLGATHEQLTTDPGVEWFPSVSPDGEWVVYAGRASGDWDIYLKAARGQNPINLTEHPAVDDQPAFSPDGQRIAFRSSRDGGGIFVMGRTGEAVRRVTRRGYKPTWSPDGTRLAYVTENVEMNPQNAYGPSELWVVDVESGEEHRIDVVDAVLPSWSPNGHRIAYTRRLDYPARGVWTVPADGGPSTAATNHLATDWNPTWSPDGGYLYFVSDRSGSMNLWRIRIDERSGETTGEPEPIVTPAVSLGHISFAANGSLLAYSSAVVSSNIQELGFDPEAREVVGEPNWLTSGSRRWSSPDPSPDGRWVAFYSLVVPEGDVYVMRADGSDLRQITGDSAIDRVPRWSPDGEWLAFFSDRDGPADVWKVHVDGSDLTRLTDSAGGVPVWSPDGSRMVTTPAAGGLSSGIVFDPADPLSEDPQRLPDPDPALEPFIPNSWTADGNYLAGDIGFTDTGIVVYSVPSARYERLTDFGQWPVWLPDGRHLLFVSGGKRFFVVDRVTKEVEDIYSATWDVLGPPRLTPDGRRMYYSRRTSEADIWLLSPR